MKILTIIPAYNEEKRISDVIILIKKHCPTADICVINDFSCDRTAFFAKKSGATVLNHPINLGYGVSLQTGYKYAYKNRYDLVIQLDGDGQHKPEYIPELIEFFKNHDTNVIIGSRFLLESGYKAQLTRRIGMFFFRCVIRIITGKTVTDPTSGYQLISKELLPFLISDNFPSDFPDADIIIMYHYLKYKVLEFPMGMNECDGQSMHNGLTKNIYYMFKMCLSIINTVISEHPKRKGDK